MNIDKYKINQPQTLPATGSWPEAIHVFRSEGQDLQYRFDTVARLGEAQALGAVKDREGVADLLDPLHYLSPGMLWWVFNYESAKAQYKDKCKHKMRCPQPPDEKWQPEHGSVLLIDEIDKALKNRW